jgi:surface polysaccharide O-acyltransferase-like enzyme
MGGWYYQENDKVDMLSTIFFAFYLTFTQAYFMSLLFMVSGYFTQMSLVRKGTPKFIRGRLFRLGLPLLIYIFLIHPVAVILVYPDMDFWSWYLGGIRTFNFISWTGPLWFVEALLIFTFIYLVFFKLFIKRDFKIKLKISNLNVILLIATISVLAFSLRLANPIGSDFYNLQFSFFSAYMFMFAMGILAYAAGWFEQVSFRDGKKWLIVSLGLGIPAWFAIVFLGGVAEGNMQIEGGMNWPAFAYALWESFFCVTFILALLGLYKYKVNVSGKFQKFLSDNAFGVFVFHAPVLIGISMLLKEWDLYPILKFLIVAVMALTGSFLFSWLVRRIGFLRKVFS